MTIPHDYKEQILIPSVLLKDTTEEAVTRDGVKVRLRFIGTYNNENGECANVLDWIAMKLYDVHFVLIEKKWSSSFHIDNHWHYVELNPIRQ